MKNQKGMLKPSPLMRPNVSMVRPWSRGQRKRDGRKKKWINGMKHEGWERNRMQWVTEARINKEQQSLHSCGARVRI